MSLKIVILLFLLVIIVPGAALAEEMTFFTIFHVDKDQTYNCTFGLREDAIPGFDGLDQPAPPAAPDEDLDGFLAMVDPPAHLPNRWYRDFRPVDNLILDRIEYFPFNLNSTHVGEIASISVATGAFNSLPYEMWIHGPGGFYEEIPVPGSINFIITSTHMNFFWELRLDDQVPNTEETLAGIKALYR